MPEPNALSSADFGDLMAELPAGVAVITTGGPDGPMGLAVTSLTAYTGDPPSIMTSVDHSSRSHDLLMEAERFGVHILHHGQAEIAGVFASKADDKFGQLDWDWDDEIPKIHGAHAYVRCRRDATFSHRDHSVLIGLIETIEREEERGTEPMVYLRRAFAWRLHQADKS